MTLSIIIGLFNDASSCSDYSIASNVGVTNGNELERIWTEMFEE